MHFRLVLANFKLDLDHGLLVVVDAHFAIILIVLLVLEQGDPLAVGV